MRSYAWVLFLVGCGAGPLPASSVVDDPEIVEVATGERLSFEALIERLARARVVYVGERHDRRADHRIQRVILESLYARDPDLAIGFEMFQRPYQGVLDAYVAGAIDEAALLEQTAWETRWGFDFAMYRPLVRVGPERGLHLLALNAPRELTRTIAREGLESLDASARAALPEMDRSSVAHRARVEAALREHPQMNDAALERFYTAQLVWDETMAETIAAHGGRVIVFAGAMHVARDAIPNRAARRGARPYQIVIPEDRFSAETAADYVWITAAP